MNQTERSKRLKVDGLRKLTVLKFKSGRSNEKIVGDLEKVGQKGSRSKRINLDGLQKCKWTVQKQKLDGLKEWN